MKILSLLAVSGLALFLAACGGSEDAAVPQSDAAKAPMEKADGGKMDHSGHDMGGGAIGHATGVIKSLGGQGEYVTIDHGPIEGIGMGAMTMGFGIQGDVDLSPFAVGDRVSFMVKKGRDNAYRIAAMCKTDTDGADCLAQFMDP